MHDEDTSREIDDLREMLGVYDIDQTSLWGNVEDLILTGLYYFAEHLGIKTTWVNMRGVWSFLTEHFDEETAEYIYDTIKEEAYEYEEIIPREVAESLAKAVTKKFEIDVDWTPVDYLNNMMVSFELTADEDEVEELYREDDDEDEYEDDD